MPKCFCPLVQYMVAHTHSRKSSQRDPKPTFLGSHNAALQQTFS